MWVRGRGIGDRRRNGRFGTYLSLFFLFFLFKQCLKRVTQISLRAILPCGPLKNLYTYIQ